MLRAFLLIVTSSILISCGGGSDSNDSQTPETQPVPPPVNNPPPTPPDDNQPPPENDPDDAVDIIETDIAAARLLTQGTFGPNLTAINELVGTSSSQWYLNQVAMQPTLLSPQIVQFDQLIEGSDFNFFRTALTSIGFWSNAIQGQDQLRQRVAFALSEILVVSNASDILESVPQAVATYQDILITQAFGNYREILQDVTYSPAMGVYLTYLGSQRSDPETGRMPDENYARELLQLFTLGLTPLNPDGSNLLDEEGNPIELFDNQDITGLARVFTGLNFDFRNIGEERALPVAFTRDMRIIDAFHSQREKSFLGLTIPENTDGATSIDLALDHIFSQPTLGPFVSRQLIQRLVTSSPSASYVQRVTQAFDSGQYILPNGTLVGEQQRGDLNATVAAILFDQEARDSQEELTFGKVREPILRFTHWTRAFNVSTVTPELTPILWETSNSDRLGQHPYRSPSVFNFFRPGFVAPGTLTGEQGLTIPELQIMNASSITGYTNFMAFFIASGTANTDTQQLEEDINQDNRINMDFSQADQSFLPDYTTEIELAAEPESLLEHLNILLLSGNMSQGTQENILAAISAVPIDDEQTRTEQLTVRVELAILMLMTSPDYLIQR